MPDGHPNHGAEAEDGDVEKPLPGRGDSLQRQQDQRRRARHAVRHSD